VFSSRLSADGLGFSSAKDMARSLLIDHSRGQLLAGIRLDNPPIAGCAGKRAPVVALGAWGNRDVIASSSPSLSSVCTKKVVSVGGKRDE